MSTWRRGGSSCSRPPVAFAHPLDGGRAGAILGSVDDTAADPGRRRPRLPPPLRPSGPGRRQGPAHRARPSAPPAPAPAGYGPPGPARAPARHRPGPAVRDRRGQGACWPGPPPTRCCPSATPLTASYGMLFVALAHAYGWPVVEGGSSRVIDALVAELGALGAKVEPGPLGEAADRAARGADRAPRHLAPQPGDPGRGPAQRLLPGGARAVPLRPRRLQGRLGAQRAGALGGAGVPAGRDGPRGRDARGGRRQRGRGGRRPPSRTALLPGSPARRGGPEPRPGRPAHAVGLLPRALGLVGRHDRAHRGPDRALCARLPRPGAGQSDQDGGGDREGQPQLRGRRHHRRSWPPCARRSSAPRPGGTTTGPRHPACTFARRRPRPAVGSMACAATGRPARPWPTSTGAAEPGGRPAPTPGGANLPFAPPVITMATTPVITLPPLPPPF